MKLLACAAVLVLVSGGAAHACQQVSSAEQAKVDARQHAEFKNLVLQTAARAEAIYIAKVQHVTDNPHHAIFQIDKVLKGHATSGSLATFALPDNIDGMVLSCGGPEEFGNVYAVPGESFIIYVVAGRLVRSAPIERGKSNLTFPEELHFMQAAHGT